MVSNRKRGTHPAKIYGVPMFYTIEEQANTLLDIVKLKMAGVDFFTREDLLQTGVFDHVSTIYRYKLVCEAVRFLIDRRQLIEKSKTDLCIAGKSRAYLTREVIYETYHVQVEKLMAGRRGTFSVMDIVRAWSTDQHLTDNVKRILVRRISRSLVRDEKLTKHGYGFSVKKGD